MASGPLAKEGKPARDLGSAHSHLGDQGELWFAAALPLGWVWQPPRRDFGKDGLIVIRDGSELHNLEFSVQIKTSERPRVHDGFIVLSGMSRSSIRYWFASLSRHSLSLWTSQIEPAGSRGTRTCSSRSPRCLKVRPRP